MSQLLTEPFHMAGRKKESFDRGRVEFKAEPEWIERANRVAVHLGLNLSAFMRMVVTEYLDQKEAEQEDARRTRTARRKPE